MPLAPPVFPPSSGRAPVIFPGPVVSAFREPTVGTGTASGTQSVSPAVAEPLASSSRAQIFHKEADYEAFERILAAKFLDDEVEAAAVGACTTCPFPSQQKVECSRCKQFILR